MLLRNVFTKTLRDQGRALVVWAFYLAAVVALYSSLYPSISGSLTSTTKGFSNTLKVAFSLQDLGSPAGYLASTAFALLGPLLVIAFAVIFGAKAIAGEEESGIVDLLLAHPVSRAGLALQRSGALAVGLAVLGLAVFVALLVASGPADLHLPAGNLAAMSLHLALLGACFGSLALGVGAATGRRVVAVSVAGGAAALAYLANAFLSQIDGLHWLKDVSPFNWYSGGQPLEHGLQAGHAALLLGVSVLAVAAGIVRFRQRDVGV